MKLLLAITITLVLAVSQGWGAEKQPEARSFASFWSQFKASVTNGNKEAIAGMTKFPFTYLGDQLAKADFIKKYDEILSKKTQRCFGNTKPVKDTSRDNYSVFCGSSIYTFEKVNGEYKFTDVGEND